MDGSSCAQPPSSALRGSYTLSSEFLAMASLGLQMQHMHVPYCLQYAICMHMHQQGQLQLETCWSESLIPTSSQLQTKAAKQFRPKIIILQFMLQLVRHTSMQHVAGQPHGDPVTVLVVIGHGQQGSHVYCIISLCTRTQSDGLCQVPIRYENFDCSNNQSKSPHPLQFRQTACCLLSCSLPIAYVFLLTTDIISGVGFYTVLPVAAFPSMP